MLNETSEICDLPQVTSTATFAVAINNEINISATGRSMMLPNDRMHIIKPLSDHTYSTHVPMEKLTTTPEIPSPANQCSALVRSALTNLLVSRSVTKLTADYNQVTSCLSTPATVNNRHSTTIQATQSVALQSHSPENMDIFKK